VKASAPRTPAKGIVASESDGGIYPEEETIQAARGEPGSKRRNPLLEPSGGDGGGSPAKQGGGNLSGGRSSGSSERDGSSKHEPNAKQRWGRGRGRSTIGLERKVDIHVAANRIIIGGDGIVVPIEHGVSREKLVEQVLAGMDEAAREWNDPPEGFHYVPTVKFRVYPGGNQNYERVNGALKKMGLVCSAQFAVGDRPPAGRSE
jgi:hypothetical protein